MSENISKIAEEIRRDVYRLLDSRGGSYDGQHIPGVERYCVALAEFRGLCKHTARMIGLLHDIARIERGIYGRGHAQAGAEIAQTWLEERGADTQTVETVAQAIRYHNKKKRIGGPYAELIRDADSLAHQDEFMGSLPRYERARCDLAYQAQFSMRYTNEERLQSLFESTLRDALQGIRAAATALPSEADVHALRVNIRTLRAALWLADAEENHGPDQALKAVFKQLEYARLLAVFRKSLGGANLAQSAAAAVEQTLGRENARISAFLQSYDPAPILRGAAGWQTVSNADVSRKLEEYRSAVMRADAEDIESLHRLRIVGKRVKYLAAGGVLTLTNETDAALLGEYHDAAGRLNDAYENARLLSALLGDGALVLPEEDTARLQNEYAAAAASHQKDARLLLFKLKKRLRQ